MGPTAEVVIDRWQAHVQSLWNILPESFSGCFSQIPELARDPGASTECSYQLLCLDLGPAEASMHSQSQTETRRIAKDHLVDKRAKHSLITLQYVCEGGAVLSRAPHPHRQQCRLWSELVGAEPRQKLLEDD